MHRLFNIFALFVLFSTFSVFLLFFVLYIKDINIKFDIICSPTNVFMSRKDLNYFRYVKLGDGQTVNLVLKFKS